MIPKEMAQDLYNKFYSTDFHPVSVTVRRSEAKKNATTCVNEILRACNQVYNSDMVHFKETGDGEWWLEVINQIKNI